jgi:hypothetical protein
MKSFLLFFSTSLLFIMTDTKAENFSEGQIWSYKTRVGEQASTLLINKVERNPNSGFIYHISVAGVSVKNRHTSSSVTHELPHFPVSLETLRASCTKVVGHSKPNPEYLEGYKMWKHAFDQGKAGVFKIPVSEIIDVVETSVNK